MGSIKRKEERNEEWMQEKRRSAKVLREKRNGRREKGEREGGRKDMNIKQEWGGVGEER